MRCKPFAGIQRRQQLDIGEKVEKSYSKFQNSTFLKTLQRAEIGPKLCCKNNFKRFLKLLERAKVSYSDYSAIQIKHIEEF